MTEVITLIEKVAQTRTSVLVEGESFAAQLDRFFTSGWDSPYVEAVDPGTSYQAPRISDPRRLSEGRGPCRRDSTSTVWG